MPRVLMDARLAVRGLGIASAVERLEEAFARRDDCSISVNRSGHGWTRRGKIDTIARSGLLDVNPWLDPRSWGADVVHYFGNTCPRRPSNRTIVTVHDLMMLGAPGRKSRIYEELLVPGLLRRRARIVAISGRTADALMSQLGIAAHDIEVIPHGHRRLPVWEGQRQHVLMFGGSGDSRKRIDLGVQAYARYAAEAGAQALPLVIAGRAGVSPEHLALAGSAPIRVERDPDSHTLGRLLAQAACLLYPSSWEGYGLPILEAGEVGTPVVYEVGADIPPEPSGRHVFGAVGSTPEAFASSLAAAVTAGPIHDALTHKPTWEDVVSRYVELYREVAR